MRFLWPQMLWLLLAIPALIAAYLYALSRKRKAAVRFASLMLVRDALTRGQSIRRHLPPALFLVAMAIAILAIARPTATITLPSDRLTLILAMDVSRSMQAADITPNRISAAQTAVKAFVEDLPRNVRMGIVSFAGTASVVQSPTENREDLVAAIDRFELQRATATGSGLLLSLQQLLPDAGVDLESAVFDSAFSRYGGGAASLDKARKAKSEKKDRLPPVPAGSYTGGAIVLLSDGRRTTGPDPLEAAKQAADLGVRVFTVGFGTKEGAPVEFGDWSIYMRLDEETLKGVAAITGAEYFHAGSGTDLRKVYEKLTSKFAMERKETEISALLSAAAVLLVVGAAVLSLRWFHRRA
ncbi:MAG: VWA domain-containing protein [Betaproteobacteria bacterium]